MADVDKMIGDFVLRLAKGIKLSIDSSASPLIDRFVSACLSEDASGHEHDEKGLFTSKGSGPKDISRNDVDIPRNSGIVSSGESGNTKEKPMDAMGKAKKLLMSDPSGNFAYRHDPSEFTKEEIDFLVANEFAKLPKGGKDKGKLVLNSKVYDEIEKDKNQSAARKGHSLELTRNKSAIGNSYLARLSGPDSQYGFARNFVDQSDSERGQRQHKYEDLDEGVYESKGYGELGVKLYHQITRGKNGEMQDKIISADEARNIVGYIKPQKQYLESESPDDPLERMEWETRRDMGKTGELPGA